MWKNIYISFALRPSDKYKPYENLFKSLSYNTNVVVEKYQTR